MLLRLRAFHRPRRSHWLDWSVVSEVLEAKGTEVLVGSLGEETRVLNSWLGVEAKVLIGWEVMTD